MQDLLVMEETVMKCSLKLPGECALFQRSVDCKENEESKDQKLTLQEFNEHTNETLSESKKNFKDERLCDVENKLQQCSPSLYLQHSNIPCNYLSCTLKEEPGGTLCNKPVLEFDSKESSKLPVLLNSQETKSIAPDLIVSAKQCPESADTNKCENIDEKSTMPCTRIGNLLDVHEDVNSEIFKEMPPIALEKMVRVSEVGDAQVVDSLNNGNECHPKCEGRLEGVENSSGYLSQCISNSVVDGGVEQSTDVSENAVKSSNQLVPTSGEDKEQCSLESNNISKMQEAERTQNHIRYLLEHLPELAKYFNLHKKIGVGTFSSVFLGSLKEDIIQRFPELKYRKFAVKHLVPTLLPKRIARELKYLHQIGGKDNVIGVDFSLRNGDCVVFIMPYFAHKRFSDYVLDMDVDEARDYMRNLMIALRRVHSFHVIHRDVKPSNFLYNRESRRYLLVDFGLSQNVHPQWTVDEKLRKRKRQEENCSENMKKPGQTLCKLSSTELKSKRMIFQSRSREENTALACNGISQPVKRLKLNDPYARGQKMIDHLYQQKMTSFENKRTPLTPKMQNQQNPSLTQSFKLPYSSPKIDKDINIKKKLFPTNNENELPNASCVEVESPNRSKLSSSFALRRAAHSYVAGTNSSSFVPHGNTEVGVATPNGLNQNNETSKQKFQTLVPKPSKDGNNGGSTIVRVQNSQVKSQTLKPLSPLESEQQRKLLFSRQRNKRLSQSVKELKCFCKDMPQVCNTCLKQRAIPAPRAGTPGFRPPEVLLKYPMQTTAVDMWAAGVIMLCILSGCYPFFRSPDDITGLAEIMIVFGTDGIKQVAKSLGRTVQCSHDKPPLDLRKLCERLRRRRKERASGLPDTTNTLPICPKCENSIEIEYNGCFCIDPNAVPSSSGQFPSPAYDLLQKLLDLNPVTRISAEEALQHPFLKGDC